MSYFKSVNQKDGTVNFYPWSLGDTINVSFTSFLLMLALIGLVSAIVPAFCLLLYSISVTRHRKEQAIVGVFGAVIWTLDYSFGIFSWHLFHKFPELYSLITTVNIILLVLHIVTLFFDELTSILCEIKDGFLISIVLFGGIIYFTFPIVHKFLSLILTMSETSLY